MKIAAGVSIAMVAAFALCCGKATLENETPTPSSAPEQSTLFAYAAARGMPEIAPRTPSQHFRLTGELLFFQDNKEILQVGELWLGGPSAMRFSLGKEKQSTNIFLLATPTLCWVRTPGKEFVEYPPIDLWKETLIRWHTLRFPWGWTATPEGEFALETKLGTLFLDTGDDKLPTRVSLRESHVTLSDWQTSPTSTSMMPMSWEWTTELGRRMERFGAIEDQALFLSSAFTPNKLKASVTLTRSSEGDAALVGEELDLVELSLRFMSEEDWELTDKSAPGAWWLHQGQRFFVLTPSADDISGVQQIEKRTWLYWATVQKTNGKDALAFILSLLPQLDVQADGSLWSLQDGSSDIARHVFLLPVVRK